MLINEMCNTWLKWNVHKSFTIHLTYETVISWILVGEILKKAKKNELMDAAKALYCKESGQIREYKAGYCTAFLDRVSLSDTAF